MSGMRSRSGLSLSLLALLLCASLACPPRSWSASRNRQSRTPGARQAAESMDNPDSPQWTVIPGPLRSFERMAGISQQASTDNILPLFALKVFSRGYGESRDRNRGGKPTEFLVLVELYLRQARQLQTLAGPKGVIRATDCEQAKPLLEALGYRLEQPCGPHTSLETEDPNRAFLTIDSGFPLAQLEQALRSGKPFQYPYASSSVPILFTAKDWTASADGLRIPGNDLLDAIVEDPALAHFYWAMSLLDSETAAYLKQKIGIDRLIPYGPILDYYGQEISIRSGRVLLPGGATAEPAWQALVGASPGDPAKFVRLLLRKDDGWLAAYYDALSRIGPARQSYFTASGRMRTFYEALRGDDLNPVPARPVFRIDPGLLLLVTRLTFDRNGQPHVPGNLQVWKAAVREMKSDSRIVHRWAPRAPEWKSSEDLVAAMFAFSRIPVLDGPVQMFLAMDEIDRGRSAADRLTPQTVRTLIDDYPRFHDQYLLFSEFHGLSDSSIALFLRAAEDVDRLRSSDLRANAVGMFQAEIGLWQILARQGEIPGSALNASFREVIRPFTSIGSSAGLFDAGRSSFQELCRAAGGSPNLSQDEFIALLAGPNTTTPLAAEVRQTLANRISAVMNEQRLVSLDTLFTLGAGMEEMAQGKAKAGPLLPLTVQLHQFEMPQSIFSARETANWNNGLGGNNHATNQTHVDLKKILESPPSPRQLLDARGLLAPFLRDSLVGLNYAYYQPPAAEMARNDPLLVRAHDFSGMIAEDGGESWQTPFLVGRGWTAGQGAHLAGSLADLAYVLADMEQDFIVPKNVQALIWRDMVPTLLTDAVVPRWWGITRNELHAAALYQRAGEELLAASANKPQLRARVMDILAGRMLPARRERIEDALRAGRPQDALAEVTPADTFFLTAEFRAKFPHDSADWGPAGRELESLSLRYPSQVSLARLSRDFGDPHPALAFTYSRQLLDVPPFPTFMGYSSRLLGESWGSANLYWARLADEAGYAPVMLNLLVPELTRAMVVNIFASYTGDSSALLRALRETGQEFRRGQIPSPLTPGAGLAASAAGEP
jgi:hypothetical protein